MGDLRVDLVQGVSPFGQFSFTRVDLSPDFVLGFTDTRYLRVRSGKLGFQRLELFARMMGIERSQIGKQCDRFIREFLRRNIVQRRLDFSEGAFGSLLQALRVERGDAIVRR